MDNQDDRKTLEYELRRAKVENQIWRESVATLRELIVNYAPFVSQSKSYEGIQKMMAIPKYLAKLVTDRIDKENAKYAAIEASGTVSKPPEEPQVGG